MAGSELRLEKIFEKYLKTSVIATVNGVDYSVSRVLSTLDAAAIHKEVIEKGFMDVNASTGEHQHMTLEEFEDDVASLNVVKFFAHLQDKVIAVMTVHIGLERVVWVDISSVNKIQRSIDENAPALYIGTVVIDPMYRGVDRIGTEMMRQAFKEYLSNIYTEKYKPLIFFDCVWKNIPFVPGFVQNALSDAGGKSAELEVFEYFVDSESVKYLAFEPLTSQKRDKEHGYFVVGPKNLA